MIMMLYSLVICQAPHHAIVGPIDRNIVVIPTSTNGPQDVDPSDGSVGIGVESCDRISKEVCKMAIEEILDCFSIISNIHTYKH